MSIELSDDEFAVIHAALHKVCHPFTDGDIVEILKGERAAWKIVDRVAAQLGLSEVDGTLHPRAGATRA